MKSHWKTVLAWLGGLVSISSCEQIGQGVEMYGCPYSDYDINILVTDEDGNPIPGISATRTYPEGSQIGISDKDGIIRAELPQETGCFFILKDTDGEANGGDFEDKSIEDSRDLKLTRTQKGEGWYRGRFNATGTVKMAKKKING